MEVLTSLIPKLAELLIGEYNLQKEVKGGIIFLQSELEHIKVALEKISKTPVDQLDEQDKIWARDVRELSYDIEDKIDTFMVRCKVSKTAKGHGFKKVLDRSLDLLTQPKIRRKIATDIRDIKGRVKDVSERRDRYKFNNNDVPKPVRIDPRLFTRYEKSVELIGIDEATDELAKRSNSRINVLEELREFLDNERSLEQLFGYVNFNELVNDKSTDIIQELGLLAELRVLRICLLTGKWNDKLMDSVRKLQKLQDLCIFKRGGQRSINVFDDWVAPRCLRRLDTLRVFWFSRLPVWMNNTSHLVDLSHLSIAVRELEQKDLEILGRLPSLCRLQLEVDHQDIGIVGRLFTVGCGSFPCLVFCELRGFLRPVVFQQGALPKLRRLAFDFHAREAREIAGNDGGFNLGLGNLPSLEYVGVSFRSAGASQQEVEEAKAALKQATEIHPNRPEFQIER
ncbi:hypothetical protein PR202_ga22539 [Eleusine coracana subsp. coracana]|uniref:Rx N-terminal domain-containing protein n=1 Tax=Eleusine coracana subsp. coracana TaxID=191504 RepID=A0AAV5D3X7_ELECO|nr:hypothetical protein PR202_ga22539 [Eleusine coracana subsp. coracana]